MTMIDVNSFGYDYEEPMSDEQIFAATNVGEGEFLARIASANGIVDEKYQSVYIEYIFEIAAGQYKGYNVGRNAYIQKTRMLGGRIVDDKPSLLKSRQFNDKIRKATDMKDAKSPKETEGAFVYITVIHIGDQKRPYIADVKEVPRGTLDQALKDESKSTADKSFDDDINF